jgi:lipopolysaccharide transport system ATP-binding protein
MTNPAITVEKLGKEYHIGLKERKHTTFREALIESAKAPLKRLQRLSGRTTDDRFWALRDVSFDVPHGEVLGIIGRNGAGKSTLLKILSRITEPTSGRATINGRVASLLEVGTGFHNELTGRENVYLNGAILGMSRTEITRKFDEIVDFAGVERFLDTPIKRYSSGMKVRLAFAVAAHLEPEILIIDEVLAVGDQEFQAKCLGKMNDVATSGRTVLFVSHNMAAVESLCSRVALLQDGQMIADGETHAIIADYLTLNGVHNSGCVDLSCHGGRKKRYQQVMDRVALLDEFDRPLTSVSMGDGLSVSVSFASSGLAFCPVLGVVVKNSVGTAVFGVNNRLVNGFRFEKKQSGVIYCHFASLPLMPGIYSIDLYLGDEHQNLDAVTDAVTFEVVPADVYGTGKLPRSKAGLIFWDATWSVRDDASQDRQAHTQVGIGL